MIKFLLGKKKRGIKLKEIKGNEKATIKNKSHHGSSN
jgi:hypothetical protein